MTKRFNRRQLLRGLGGFALTLPLLPSLMPREARGGEPPFAANPRFVFMRTEHGGVWNANMYPSLQTAPNTRDLYYPGHQMHYGPLQAEVVGDNAVLSPVLTAPSHKLSDNLIAKMNVLTGLDIMFYTAHHRGANLGNFADIDESEFPPVDWRPTIDQVMAWSPSFYPDINNIPQRSVHIGEQGLSWGYINPNMPEPGDVMPIASATGSRALFDQIFGLQGSTDPSRPLVVDRVHESYKQLRDGAFGDAARLSAADRQRLEQHMALIDELERKLNVQLGCEELETPAEEANDYEFGSYTTNIPDMRRHYELYNDVLVAAFTCGATRIATIRSNEMWSTAISGDLWHDQIAHETADVNGSAQQVMADAQRAFFESVFLDLVNKLEAIEEVGGTTLLDNSLVVWSQESGNTTHSSDGTPLVQAGSAAGVMRTGQFLDYRNHNNMTLAGPAPGPGSEKRPGLSYNQYLATVLQAMNVPPSEFEAPGEHGYGIQERFVWDGNAADAWPQVLLDRASEPLPELMV